MNISKINGISMLFLLAATQVFGQESQKIVIKGKIDTVPFAVYEVVYNLTFDSLVTRNLTLDENSEFELSGTIFEPAGIEFRYYRSERERVSPYFFWIEPNESMRFHGKNFPGGGIGNAYSLTNSAVDSTRRAYAGLSKSVEKIDEKDRDSIRKQFIVSNIDSYFALRLLWEELAEDKIDYAFLDSTFAKLSPAMKNTNLANNIQRKRNLIVGAELPDFSQPDAAGKVVKVSDFRGKYLLVEFWASWCGPCRAESPALIKAYAKYRQAGFEILGISLDDDRDKWLRAVQEDGLLWEQVSDLRGFRRNKAAYQLLIQGIPDNFLLDPQGRILARELRGEALNNFLKTIFQEK